MTLYETRLKADSDRLHADVASLADDVHNAIQAAVRALLRRDSKLAFETVLGDHPINRRAEALEAAAHRFIARHLPSAGHLRFVSSVMRIAVILERMGDYAATIGREAAHLTQPLTGTFRSEVEAMAADSLQMFRQAVQAFVERDESLARGTMGFAKQVDRDFAIAFSMLVGNLDDELSGAELFSRLAVISRLERVSDQAKNLCEETVFALTGETKKRRPVRLLFIDETDDGPTQIACALVNKQVASRAKAWSAGLRPASSVQAPVADFLVEHGYDSSVLSPASLDDLERPLKDFDVVIALNSSWESMIAELPYFCSALDWTVATGDIDQQYREIAGQVSDLVELMRGPEAS